MIINFIVVKKMVFRDSKQISIDELNKHEWRYLTPEENTLFNPHYDLDNAVMVKMSDYPRIAIFSVIGVLSFPAAWIFYLAELERTLSMSGVGVFGCIFIGGIFLTLTASNFGYKVYEIKEGMEELEKRYNASKLENS